MLLPLHTGALIEWLDKTYPHKCVPPDATMEQAHRYAGRRELVDELVNWLNSDSEAERLLKP